MILPSTRPHPCQIPQLSDGEWQHETAAQQPVLEQLGTPLAILGVSLALGDGLKVLRPDWQ
jgi:hypothetical protein